MMREAPEALDVGRETPATLAAYGIADGDTTSFGYQCLIARRLVERGVRVVELIDTGSNNNWDAHGNMQEHRPKALRVDRAIAALLEDLKQRGLLSQTLVAICTEFGRTPWTDAPETKGRNHYAKAFTALLAGAGVKGGMAFGETDEFGINIVAEPGPCPRLPRDDPPPHGHRSHPAGLSLRGPRLPPHRRRRQRGDAGAELIGNRAGGTCLRDETGQNGVGDETPGPRDARNHANPHR